MHHLQIMEALGGDALWIDRFLAQHGAILYYWVLVGFYLLFPNLAYNFSELVESHASDTYAVFVDVRAAPQRRPSLQSFWSILMPAKPGINYVVVMSSCRRPVHCSAAQALVSSSSKHSEASPHCTG